MKHIYRLLVLSIFLTAFLAKIETGSANKSLSVNDPFPMKTSLKALKGSKGGDFQSLIKGKKLMIVDFWASWCGPCQEAMPVLNSLEKKYKSKGLVVVGVNVDEEKKAGLDFLEQNKVDFKILYDDGKQLIKKVGVSTMPSSFIVNSAGKIVYVHKGFRTGDDKTYEKEILAHLPKK